jgi:hypothetical protein
MWKRALRVAFIVFFTISALPNAIAQHAPIPPAESIPPTKEIPAAKPIPPAMPISKAQTNSPAKPKGKYDYPQACMGDDAKQCAACMDPCLKFMCKRGMCDKNGNPVGGNRGMAFECVQHCTAEVTNGEACGSCAAKARCACKVIRK